MLRDAGAVAVGIAEAGEVSETAWRRYVEWIELGMASGMGYMRNHMEIRRDARLLLEGARSMIVCAFSYRPQGEEEGSGAVEREGIATYALGEDYHDRTKRLIRGSGIRKILGEEGKDWRICVDSAPVLERYWAEEAGIGWRGMGGAIVVPGVGTEVTLAEIVTVKELSPDGRLAGDCGRCGACVRACPTGASGERGIDCDLCLSYLTIEHRGEWTDERHIAAMGTAAGRKTLFGCDRCMRVCPHNDKSVTTGQPPLPGVATLTRAEACEMSQEEFSRRMKGSAFKRAKLAGLRRNALGTEGIKWRKGETE